MFGKAEGERESPWGEITAMRMVATLGGLFPDVGASKICEKHDFLTDSIKSGTAGRKSDSRDGFPKKPEIRDRPGYSGTVGSPELYLNLLIVH